MAEWKKVITSGSDVSQLNNDAGYLTVGTLNVPNGFSTASLVFAGGAALLTATSPTSSLTFASSSGQGLTISLSTLGGETPYAGPGLTFGLSDIPNTSLANSTISGVELGEALYELTFGGGLYAGAYSGSEDTTISVNSSSMQAYFNSSSWAGVSGVIEIDGSGISTFTSTAGDLISGSFTSVSSSIAVDIASNGASITSINAFTQSANTSITSLNSVTASYLISASVIGTANEVEVLADGLQGIQIGLPNNVAINNDLTVGGDLIVNGDLTYLNVANLQVQDQFILLNSGSNTGDGGIVVQSGSQGEGELFGWDYSSKRWGFGTSFDASGSIGENAGAYTSFAAQIVTGSTGNPNAGGTILYEPLNAAGNIFIGAAGSIWIYS
jgi:hypothetical protein